MKDKRLLIIFLTVFIDLVGFGIIIPLNPYLAEAFGATPLQVGLLMSAYSLAQFIFSPVWGQLSDRYGRRPIILTSLCGAAVAHTAFGFATTLNGLILARLIAGIFGGNISAAMAYIADITPEKDRSKGMGMIGAAFGLGFVCGPGLGVVFAVIGKHLGSAPPFGGSFPAIAAGFICFLNFLSALKFLPESRVSFSASEEKRFRFRKIAKAFSTPVLGGLVALVFLSTFAMAQIEAMLFLYMQNNYHWTLTQTGLGFAYIGVIMVITQGYLIRKLMPKLGEPKMLITGIIFTAAAFTLMATFGNLWILAMAVTLLGLGTGFVNPSLSGGISLVSSTDEQGGHLGVSQSLSSLARILGPPVGGALYQSQGADIPFVVAAAVSVLSLFIASRLRAHIPSRGKL
jgi:MFS family permease